MKRMIVKPGTIAPALEWIWRDEGPRKVHRRGTVISEDSDGRKASPVSKGAK